MWEQASILGCEIICICLLVAGVRCKAVRDDPNLAHFSKQRIDKIKRNGHCQNFQTVHKTKDSEAVLCTGEIPCKLIRPCSPQCFYT